MRERSGSIRIDATEEQVSPTREVPAVALSDNRRIRKAALKAASDSTGLPRDFRLKFKVESEKKPSRFGLSLRFEEESQSGIDLCFDLKKQIVTFGKQQRDEDPELSNTIECVRDLDKPFTVDIVVKGYVLDACIDNRRTIVTRNSSAHGDRIYFFVEGGAVRFESTEIRPLINRDEER